MERLLGFVVVVVVVVVVVEVCVVAVVVIFGDACIGGGFACEIGAILPIC